MSIEKLTLGIAGEYAVAFELCRRGVYTQLTIGNYKRADLLAMTESGNAVRIEVKAKQGPKWGNIKGVSAEHSYIVFVDLYKKLLTQRPDFYILSSKDWREVALKAIEQRQKRNPRLKVKIDEENCLFFPDQITKSGRPYRGCSIGVTDIEAYKDDWDTLLKRVQDPAYK